MGVQYYAFAIIALAATATALKCFVGSSDKKVSTDCLTLDRCIKITKDGVAAYSCNSAAVIAISGIADKNCTTSGTTETCLCDTDECNSASTQSATQAIIIFAAASMMKFVLT